MREPYGGAAPRHLGGDAGALRETTTAALLARYVGHVSITSWPTAFFRVSSASVAVIPSAASTLQTRSSQVADPTAARRMKSASAATGAVASG